MIAPYNPARGLVEEVTSVDFSALTARLRATLAERRKVRTIERELNCYSNRDLADMGLSRGDIPAVARGRLRRS